MKKLAFGITMLVLAATGTVALAGRDNAGQLRLELGLDDGSLIIGNPSIQSVLLSTSYAKMDLPLKEIASLRMESDHETALVDLRNGDKLKGAIDLRPIKLETVFGRVSVGIEHVRDIRVSLAGGVLPAGEGPLAFGGVNWMPWRTVFEVQGDKVASLPTVRPGFNYGHGGNGRGATLMSNIGSTAWKDYSLEFQFCMRGVDPALNPHGLPPDHRAGYVMFHVADAKESWNERGGSMYTLGFNGDGSWGLGCGYNSYYAVPCGYGNPTCEGSRALADGKGLKLDPEAGNKFRIDVRGTRIQAWVDGEQILDVQDEKMGECIGGQTLDHGGVGFGTPWECMIWIRNLSIRPL